MGNEDKITMASNKLVTKHLMLLYMGNSFDHLQQFNRNSRESCLASKYLQFLCLKCSEKEWESLINQKRLQAGWDFVEQPQNCLDHSRGKLETCLHTFILEEQIECFTFIHERSHASRDNIQGYFLKNSQPESLC